MSENVAVCNIEMFGVPCALLHIEDQDIRVNIVFSEFLDFTDHRNYDATMVLPNWATFLVDKYVMGKKLVLSAHLIVKANQRCNSVVCVPYVPFRPLKGVHNDQSSYLTALG